ncbi:MAG: hypothetical protein PHD61_10325 [Bacteroidales bacterium]|nr:hypothetical protein [Lentimicrobiaceae bacterium]MDD5695681.1 hypothetical protein [Bacteroidales bacterium]
MIELYNDSAFSCSKLITRFLRDLKDDYFNRGRTYFPQVEMTRFDDKIKNELEIDIQNDFDVALSGIKKLNTDSRFGVYITYFYYTRLFNKIKKARAEDLIMHRYRISNVSKGFMVVIAWFRHLLQLY